MNLSESKTSADDKLAIDQMVKIVFEGVEKIIERGKNCGLPCFKKLSSPGILKLGNLGNGLNSDDYKIGTFTS